MGCRGCGAAWCRCAIQGSDCVTREGSGNPEDPMTFKVRLDDSDTQLIENTRDGLLMRAPSQITQLNAFSVRYAGAPDSGLVTGNLSFVYPIQGQEVFVVEFNEVVLDTGGFFETSTNTFICPRTGLWSLGGSLESYDHPDDLGMYVVLDGTFSIVASGPHRTGTTQGPEQVYTHIDLEAGEQLQFCGSSSYDDVTLAKATFFGSFLGE